ncbi:hypothetical protein KB20921_20800 [Edwardsiella ictaluri]|nr:hypothetical protein KH20906_20560 [Edwardsiella ictaluri]BEI02819.1 hypothetical protein KB20921_20800 [Edwardsiella ictaluri]BEI06281.1 hypothetical protein KH201010_20670 [Edwardsiella ictaluri]BEI09741.1 hypothetical protein STU22726_20720 [Edwardsiella ictaluri]BEI13221.1 hypothetical protein STU22816_20740 [Edwardsiella ictaluri]
MADQVIRIAPFDVILYPDFFGQALLIGINGARTEAQSLCDTLLHLALARRAAEDQNRGAPISAAFSSRVAIAIARWFFRQPAVASTIARFLWGAKTRGPRIATG